ncbi:MAG: serine O-acetyltransferase EpsC [Bacteroidota bacterium]
MKSLNIEPEKRITHPIFESNSSFLRLFFDRERLGKWADEIFQWLFCIHPKYVQEEIFLTKELDLKMGLLQFIEQTQSANKNYGNCVTSFFNRLPEVHRVLMGDLDSMYNSDPAARSIHEVLLAYPGFYAIVIHRVAHELWICGIPVIPRLLAEYAHYKTGIDIHPGATIGERFLIDHGTGVVIGETCNIGNDVKIYQGVTLGALSVSRNHAAIKRHPTIGDRVVVYANATILGGNTVIGNDSVIGGNVWITQSIPSNSMVFHKSEIIIKNNSNFPEPLNFII